MEEWRLYSDIALVPLGLFFCLLYHCWLWRVVRTQPSRTNVGAHAGSPWVWLTAVVKDNDKKNILAVQSVRNNIMSSTLVATTSVLICCGLLTFTSSKYMARQSRYNEVEATTKCATALLAFLSAFLCQTLSIASMTQVNILVNTLTFDECPVTPEFVAALLEKGLFLGAVGNRLFFSSLPLVLWMLGPELAFLGLVGTIPLLYNLDIVSRDDNDKGGAGGGSVDGTSNGEFNAAEP